MTDRTIELRDDSAKKLEEDVIGRATLSYYGDGTIRLDSSYMDRASLADVFDWLDRQAAIAATLGSGTLTAEQVRKVLLDHLSLKCRDREYQTDAWQAIADELNAELGSGTCRIEERNGDWYCDACGEMVGTFDPASELFIDGNAVELWNYCPNCGRKVVSA